jgi:predicted NUDIX family NTP pyrophosphohydrolase
MDNLRMARRSAERSAGLLAFRRRRGIECMLAHPGGPYWRNRDAGSWTIPKGLVEAGGDLLATAQREFTEETGFHATGDFIPLQPVRQKSGKTVHAFAFEADFPAERFTSNRFEMEWPPKSGQKQNFPEVDRLQWFALEAALKKIIDYQRPFLEELHAILQRAQSVRPAAAKPIDST